MGLCLHAKEAQADCVTIDAEKVILDTDSGEEITFSYKASECTTCYPDHWMPYCVVRQQPLNVSCIERYSISTGKVKKDPFECISWLYTVHPIFLRKIANDPTIETPKKENIGYPDFVFEKIHAGCIHGQGETPPESNYRSDQTAGQFVQTNDQLVEVFTGIARRIKLRLIE